MGAGNGEGSFVFGNFCMKLPQVSCHLLCFVWLVGCFYVLFGWLALFLSFLIIV